MVLQLEDLGDLKLNGLMSSEPSTKGKSVSQKRHPLLQMLLAHTVDGSEIPNNHLGWW